MEYLLILFLAVFVLVLRIQMKKLRDEIDRLQHTQFDIAQLIRRIHALEQLTTPPPPRATPSPGEAAPAPPVPLAPPPPAPIRAAPPPALAPPAILPPPFHPAPAPREWEELLGGSVLNAVGAIVLVIGIALFLAYSLAHLNAAGRAGLATLASLALLAAGIWLEGRPRYRIFARGLIGAGWAALYSTSYAIYALPAARIIPNAALGALVQLAVALAMVAYSLRYRVQAVTAIAYTAVFCALAVTPSTPFAVLSLIPIAASALYLAARFEWDYLPVFALTATYFTCFSRGESGASLASSQLLFLAYWLLFELFDLRRVKLSRLSGGLEFLSPLNAAGFLSLSAYAWNQHAPDKLWLAAALGAALYLASTLARIRLRAGIEPPDTFLDRLRLGSYEASLTVSAGLALLAICGRAPGMWSAAGIAAEAEFLFLAGVRFNSEFVRGLGAALFLFSLTRLALTTDPGHRSRILGGYWRDWTPPVLLHAALFYWNRALRRADFYYSYAASLLLAGVLWAEVPHSAIVLAWAGFGYALLELALRRGLPEFRIQAYALVLLAACAGCAYPFANPDGTWWPLAAAIPFFVAAALRARPTPGASWLMLAATAASGVLLWRLLPRQDLALSWAALALVIEFGAQVLRLRDVSWQARAAALAALTAACAVNISPPQLAQSIPTAALFYALLFVARRARQPNAALYYSLLGMALVAVVLGFRVTGGLLTVAWGLLGLSLLGAGFAARERSLRVEGLALFLVCILKLFLYDLRNLETVYRILSFVALGLILLSVSWIYSRFRDQLARLL